MSSATSWSPGYGHSGSSCGLPDRDGRTNGGRLGERLFFDPVLSGDSSRSYAFCHRPGIGFTDRLHRSAALGRAPEPLRNAPTIINSALQAGLFYDLRTTFLEDQISDVVGNRHEMNGSLREAAWKLGRHREYSAALVRALEGAPHARWNEEEIRAAIAAYIRSLVRLNAPFDRYLRGDTSALDPAGRRGFNVFMGKGKCGTCHFLPLFGGTVPPTYSRPSSRCWGWPAARTPRARR